MTDQRHDEQAAKDERIREAIRSTDHVRADAAFRERLKRQFSDGMIPQPMARPEPRESPSVSRWAWLLVPAAAATILLVVVMLPSSAPTWIVYGEGQVEIAGSVFSLDDPQAVVRALEDGGEVRVLEGSSLDLRLDDRLMLALVEGTEATVPAPPTRDTGSPWTYDVRAGEMRIMTGPGFPGAQIHVLTPESRTEIVGTVVSVLKGSGYTCVCVLQGTALIGIDKATLEEVPEGMLKFMFDDGSEPMVMEIAPDHRKGLVEFIEQYEGIFEAPH